MPESTSRRGRRPYLDLMKVEEARALYLAGHRPNAVQTKVGLSYDGAMSVLNQLRAERQKR